MLYEKTLLSANRLFGWSQQEKYLVECCFKRISRLKNSDELFLKIRNRISNAFLSKMWIKSCCEVFAQHIYGELLSTLNIFYENKDIDEYIYFISMKNKINKEQLRNIINNIIADCQKKIYDVPLYYNDEKGLYEFINNDMEWNLIFWKDMSNEETNKYDSNKLAIMLFKNMFEKESEEYIIRNSLMDIRDNIIAFDNISTADISVLKELSKYIYNILQNSRLKD